MSTPPPGWYDDGSGAIRWWDGQAWTEQLFPDAVPQAPAEGGSPERPKRTWIVFAVIGGLAVVVIGLILVAAIFVPRLLGQITAGTDGAAEQAAAEVVERYDRAWAEGDCDEFFATTTDAFRAALPATDCDAFQAQVEAFDAAVDDYEIVVEDAQHEGDVVKVLTTESFLSWTDVDGAPLETPEPVELPYEYTLVPAGDGWAIDDLY